MKIGTVPQMTGAQFEANRIELDITLEDLAETLGISLTTLWRVKTTPGNIAGVYSMAMAYLLSRAPNKERKQQ